MEAIRHCVDTEGAVVLSRLDCGFARFKPHQRVDMTPGGFVAYIAYELPPYSGHIGMATVRLTWVARENSPGPSLSMTGPDVPPLASAAPPPPPPPPPPPALEPHP